MPSIDSLPHVPRYEIVPNESHTCYTILENGRVATDPQEGLPLDNIRSRAAAERIVNRMKAF